MTASAPLRSVDSVRKTATRLLGSTSRNSYSPELDIDWDAPVDGQFAGMKFLPYERVSLFGTELWERMSEQQRLELSRQELASIASTGLWFELILIQLLTRWAYHQDPQDPRTQYALAEIGDETRHIMMFAKAVERVGAPTYRVRRSVHQLARLYKATAKGPTLFAPVLVAEEILDRLQRETVNDESVHPLVRMVNRIHVVEEARHVRFAREEVARQMADIGPVAKVVANVLSALVAAFVTSSIISPEVYANIGLDRDEAVRAARDNEHYAESRRWMGEKIMAFLAEQGMVTWYTRPIYGLVHLV
ncbi:P-aminobenzoate N-oxygenase AurF [Jatrophihabitans endophyticus]|uniref:p-aminobenzoate N-oxygenase AurF n=1 Tax=Jatrophihabitans endophyticus TaxID=1206085 RepID=A0A1M5IA93_9ACTN|nr:diiron oxygenase [Jatrophihabitans endophyticus]SHG25145.1 P-aminobenzoate N-oxygenase AurF [Jatrophihabitans endophyticus]